MEKKRPIYLDNNATTPLDPLVFQAMRTYFESEFGNPSSQSHCYGWETSTAVEKARKQVAKTINAEAAEVFWTSGATESNNWAILGFARKQDKKIHVITTSTEHKAVLEVCWQLKREGHDMTIVPVDQYGQVSTEDIEKAIKPNTAMVSVIFANNEIGTINRMKEIGAFCKSKNILLHTDATQSIGKTPVDVKAMNIDLLSISAHKLYGPKGVGALFIRKGVELEPLLYGGSQEKGLRPGTINVAGVVGLGAACERASQLLGEECTQLEEWRDYILTEIKKTGARVVLNGHPRERLCNNLNLTFPDLQADIMTFSLSGLALSSSSACTSGDYKISHVLEAIGVTPVNAKKTLRIGLGRFTTFNDVKVATEKLCQMLKNNDDSAAV